MAPGGTPCQGSLTFNGEDVTLTKDFPIEINTLHRLEITPEDSVATLRLKVPEYQEIEDSKVVHVINRYLNGHAGQNAADKGLTVLPPGTYIVDITDHLDWNAGDFGDGYSCYWAGYTAERRRMAREGTWALRVHLSPKHREYHANPGQLEDYIASLFHKYSDHPGDSRHLVLPDYAGRDGSRVFFVPWWRFAEHPGIEREGADPEHVYPENQRYSHRARGEQQQQAQLRPTHPGWEQLFGDRWPGDKRTAILHNPYGSLHLPQLAGLYAKLTGILPNHLDRGIANFGDALPHEYDWVFNRRNYQEYGRRTQQYGRCDNCNIALAYRASRSIHVQRRDENGERVGSASRSGNWCMECIVARAKRSPKTERWTRTKGLKWNA